MKIIFSTPITLVLQLFHLLHATENESQDENLNLPSMEDFIKEVESTENLLDGLDFSNQNITSVDDLDISDIAAKITNEITNSGSNVEDIMNSAIENIMNNIAESNNAQTTQMPTESTATFLS